MSWYVYIVECNDKSLYTGITKDVDRRIKEHNTDNVKGAKSLRGKRPVRLRYTELVKNRSEASRREFTIKKLTKEYKIRLIKGH